MKKIFLVLLASAGITSAAHAQGARFGVKAGASLSNLVGDDVDGVKSKWGFNGGLMANFGFSDLVSFQPELLYSMKGTKAKDLEETYTTLHYLDVPLLVKINAKGPFFELGPQVGFLVGQKSQVKIPGFGTQTNTDTDGLSKVDLGYIAGVGYQLESGLSLGVRYNGGLLSIDDDKDDKAKARNSVFQFQVGMLFGGR